MRRCTTLWNINVSVMWALTKDELEGFVMYGPARWTVVSPAACFLQINYWLIDWILRVMTRTWCLPFWLTLYIRTWRWACRRWVFRAACSRRRSCGSSDVQLRHRAWSPRVDGRTRAQSSVHVVGTSPGADDRTLRPAHQVVRAKLHYTDTGYGHHQRTSSQQFYNKFATSQCRSPTSRHVKMLGCGKFFVRWWCSLVVFVAVVRSRCPCSGVWL